MIFSKKVNRILAVLAGVFFVTCACLIVRINILYPPAPVITNSKDNSVTWQGCEITALEKIIYTPKDFNSAYPEVMYYRYLMEGDTEHTKSRIVVFRVRVKNVTDAARSFVLPSCAYAEAFPSAWANGIAPITKDFRLEPGQEKEMEAAAYYGPSLVYPSHLQHMEDNQFQLVFSYYPDKVVLTFDSGGQ